MLHRCARCISLFAGRHAIAAATSASLFSNDVDGTLTATSDVELHQLGMTRSQARRLVRDVILPKYRHVELVQGAATAVVAEGMFGIAMQKVRLQTGRIVAITASAEKGDNASHGSLKAMLFNGWLLEYLRANPDASDDHLTAIAWGLHRDIETLKSHGVRAIPPSDVDAHGPVPIDEFLSMLDQNLVLRMHSHR